jgi:hypothetical protein
MATEGGGGPSRPGFDPKFAIRDAGSSWKFLDIAAWPGRDEAGRDPHHLVRQPRPHDYDNDVSRILGNVIDRFRTKLPVLDEEL